MEFESVRGLQGVKAGGVAINGSTIRVAVAHGLANVESVLEEVRAARGAGREPPLHFIEVMACPGGCIGGGGQPYGVNRQRAHQARRRACINTIATAGSGSRTRIWRSSGSTTNSSAGP